MRQKKGVIVVNGRVIRLEREGLVIGLDRLGDRRIVIGSGLGSGLVLIGLREVAPYRYLIRVQFAGLVQVLDGGIVLLGFERGDSVVVGLVERIILLALIYGFIDLLLQLLLLFRRQLTSEVFRDLSGLHRLLRERLLIGVGGGGRLVGLEIEIELLQVAGSRLHAVQ